MAKYISLENLETFLACLQSENYKASSTKYGAIKVNDEANNSGTERPIKLDSNGCAYIDMGAASDSNFGAVKIIPEKGLTINEGVLSMGVASTSNFGAVKVPSGNGLTINDGVIGVAYATSSYIGGIKVSSSARNNKVERPVKIDSNGYAYITLENPSDLTMGSANDTTMKPIWMSDGKIISPDETSIGTSADGMMQPIYMDKGYLKSADVSLGSIVNPIYMDKGCLKSCDFVVENLATSPATTAPNWQKPEFGMRKTVIRNGETYTTKKSYNGTVYYENVDTKHIELSNNLIKNSDFSIISPNNVSIIPGTSTAQFCDNWFCQQVSTLDTGTKMFELIDDDRLGAPVQVFTSTTGTGNPTIKYQALAFAGYSIFQEVELVYGETYTLSFEYNLHHIGGSSAGSLTFNPGHKLELDVVHDNCISHIGSGGYSLTDNNFMSGTEDGVRAFIVFQYKGSYHKDGARPSIWFETNPGYSCSIGKIKLERGANSTPVYDKYEENSLVNILDPKLDSLKEEINENIETTHASATRIASHNQTGQVMLGSSLYITSEGKIESIQSKIELDASESTYGSLNNYDFNHPHGSPLWVRPCYINDYLGYIDNIYAHWRIEVDTTCNNVINSDGGYMHYIRITATLIDFDRAQNQAARVASIGDIYTRTGEWYGMYLKNAKTNNQMYFEGLDGETLVPITSGLNENKFTPWQKSVSTAYLNELYEQLKSNGLTLNYLSPQDASGPTVFGDIKVLNGRSLDYNCRYLHSANPSQSMVFETSETYMNYYNYLWSVDTNISAVESGNLMPSNYSEARNVIYINKYLVYDQQLNSSISTPISLSYIPVLVARDNLDICEIQYCGLGSNVINTTCNGKLIEGITDDLAPSNAVYKPSTMFFLEKNDPARHQFHVQVGTTLYAAKPGAIGDCFKNPEQKLGIGPGTYLSGNFDYRAKGMPIFLSKRNSAGAVDPTWFVWGVAGNTRRSGWTLKSLGKLSQRAYTPFKMSAEFYINNNYGLKINHFDYVDEKNVFKTTEGKMSYLDSDYFYPIILGTEYSGIETKNSIRWFVDLENRLRRIENSL